MSLESRPLLQPASTYPSHRPLTSVDSSRVRSPFLCSACLPSFSTDFVLPDRKMLTGYISGLLFAASWWLLIDAAVLNSVRKLDLDPIIWLPGILSTVSLIIVNLIDRQSLSGDDNSYDSANVGVKARAIAFVGLTVGLGSIGGALAILSLKFIIPGLEGAAMYLGIAVSVQSFLIFFSSMSFWFGRNSNAEGSIYI